MTDENKPDRSQPRHDVVEAGPDGIAFVETGRRRRGGGMARGGVRSRVTVKGVYGGVAVAGDLARATADCPHGVALVGAHGEAIAIGESLAVARGRGAAASGEDGSVAVALRSARRLSSDYVAVALDTVERVEIRAGFAIVRRASEGLALKLGEGAFAILRFEAAPPGRPAFAVLHPGIAGLTRDSWHIWRSGAARIASPDEQRCLNGDAFAQPEAGALGPETPIAEIVVKDDDQSALVGAGGWAIVGTGGVAVCGDGGLARAFGDLCGEARAGDDGIAIVESGVAVAGDRGVAVTDFKRYGEATAGDDGVAAALGDRFASSTVGMRGFAIAGRFGRAQAGRDGVAIGFQGASVAVGENGVAFSVCGSPHGGPGSLLFRLGPRRVFDWTIVDDEGRVAPDFAAPISAAWDGENGAPPDGSEAARAIESNWDNLTEDDLIRELEAIRTTELREED